MLQTDPGSLAAHVCILDVETRNLTCRNIFHDLPERTSLIHKESMDLQIPAVVRQEVSAIVIATLEARLPDEGILIVLNNARTRLSEDCVVVIPVYLVECGLVRRQTSLLCPGLLHDLSGLGIHIKLAHRDIVLIHGFSQTNVGMHPGDGIVEPGDFHQSQLVLLHDPG